VNRAAVPVCGAIPGCPWIAIVAIVVVIASMAFVDDVRSQLF
jgi:hypothetical protein